MPSRWCNGADDHLLCSEEACGQNLSQPVALHASSTRQHLNCVQWGKHWTEWVAKEKVMVHSGYYNILYIEYWWNMMKQCHSFASCMIATKTWLERQGMNLLHFKPEAFRTACFLLSCLATQSKLSIALGIFCPASSTSSSRPHRVPCFDEGDGQ